MSSAQIKDFYLGLKDMRLPLSPSQAKTSLSRKAAAITAEAALMSRNLPDINFSAT